MLIITLLSPVPRNVDKGPPTPQTEVVPHPHPRIHLCTFGHFLQPCCDHQSNKHGSVDRRPFPLYLKAEEGEVVYHQPGTHVYQVKESVLNLNVHNSRSVRDKELIKMCH